MKKNKLTLGHSPDMDDAFMFYAILKHKLDASFDIVWKEMIQEIHILNEEAKLAKLDFTAVSLYAYLESLSSSYDILTTGASVGDNYGPVVVALKETTLTDLKFKKVAVPGIKTTSALLLQLACPEINMIQYPFREVIHALVNKEVEAAVLIHEAQMTYPMMNLFKILDLGEWWYQKEALPIPLGINIVLKSLPFEMKKELNQLLKKSIEYAFQNEEEVFQYAFEKYSGGEISKPLAKKFIHRYVNHYTLNLSDKGIHSVKRLLKRAQSSGLLLNVEAENLSIID